MNIITKLFRKFFPLPHPLAKEINANLAAAQENTATAYRYCAGDVYKFKASRTNTGL